jgi:multidrug efflux pump subunit AcrB
MWIVRLALRNPYSVAVLALIILIAGVLSIGSMLVDIFPVIDIPVVGVVWNFPGLSAREVEERIVTINERAFSTTVSGISRIESQSIPGIANLRVYFQQGTDIGGALAQISATCQTILRVLPPGITPPSIFPFNASNVPVAQLTVFSETLNQSQLYDYGTNFIRIKLFTIPGLSTPAPYGGSVRQINVDVNPSFAQAKGVAPQDVVNTVVSQNLILPAGTARMGDFEYNVQINSSPLQVEEFNQIPIKVVSGRPVKIGDVARAYDGSADQTNMVRINGRPATFLNILKKAQASTLTVVDSLYKVVPEILATAPKGLKLRVDFDQSIFVRASIKSVIREACIAAALVSTMILFFLGSWRSVLIVCTSIPLAILVSIFGMKLTGQTINIMTLGGLSLAIGMLVDDATVEIENIHRNIPLSSSLTVAILKGASQIALPAIVSTLAICIVFFPIVLLTGPAKFLFTPMAEAVVLAMLASYVLSRTLVPALARMLMTGHVHTRGQGESTHGEEGEPALRWSERFNEWRDRGFERFKNSYGRVLRALMAHRRFALLVFGLLVVVSLCLPIFVIGRDFFPATDAGILKLHFRAPAGTRIERTTQIIAQVEDRIRSIIPAGELVTINSNIGVPTYFNIAFVPTDNAGEMDAEILIALAAKHQPSAEYARKIRGDLAQHFPGSAVYFQSADIVSQVLNFGLTSPIDVQIQSYDTPQAIEYAKRIRDKMQAIPGLADVVLKQVFNYPTLQINVDRIRAAEAGMSQKDVASSVLTALSSSSLVSPSYYVNPSNGVNYSVVVKVPLPMIRSVDELQNLPVTPPASNAILQPDAIPPGQLSPQAPTETLGNIAAIDTTTTLSQVNHVNVQRVLDVTASIDGRDLGSTVKELQREIDSIGTLPAGVSIHILGQNQVMHESFTKLGYGMFLAIALVYLLMVVLFQSWLDPFIIMVAVPGSLAGVLWMLALTRTTINVPSLMGSIMAVGIAVSNSNLLVNFANEIRVENPELSVEEAAIDSGMVRMRPVLMTALAMILGMLPMAMGSGEGGEQNAPLGRAVIGGLILSTIVTLLLVPVVYSLLRQGMPTKWVLQQEFKKEEKQFDLEEAQGRKIAI